MKTLRKTLSLSLTLAASALIGLGCTADSSDGGNAGDPANPQAGADTSSQTDPEPVNPDLLDQDLKEFKARYSAELEATADWTYDDLKSHYAPQAPVADLGYDPLAAGYLSEIESTFELTEAEMAQIGEDGFMVTERIQWQTHARGYEQVFVNDLPVLITTDSLLHALHRSFDELLKVSEEQVLAPRLEDMLQRAHDALPNLDASGDFADAARDADLFLTVARSLLLETVVPTKAGGDLDDEVASLLQAASELRLMDTVLFGVQRKIDFSQLEPRGHYTDSELLKRYFRSMMWLGRIDFRFREYDPFAGEFVWHDRQIRGSWLLHQAVQTSDAFGTWSEISDLIGLLVGPPDNMDLRAWQSLEQDASIAGAADLQGDLSALHAIIEQGRYGTQRINSHWLTTNPLSAEVTPLPIAFGLMGQRFIVDSHVFASVVYDNIVHEGTKVPRALPSPLDAMFVLGADNALSLLQGELETYHYAPNLHALRYLVDDYDDGFWSESVYNMWLSAIRGLNAPGAEGVPASMKTDAWAKKSLHTQLASWAELRHDTLLYAKQSYTGGVACEYPDGYVEPYPEVFGNLKEIATRMEATLGALPFQDDWTGERVATWAAHWRQTLALLESMAVKELADEPFDEDELALLEGWLKKPSEMVCGGPSFTGIYPALFFNEMHAEEADPTIADVHTNPNDQGPLAPPRVLHVGTGLTNLLVLTRNSCEGVKSYAGPVSSYYEVPEPGLDRLTDEEWSQRLYSGEEPARPGWTADFLVPAP